MMGDLNKLSLGLLGAAMMFTIAHAQSNPDCECRGQLVERTFERQCDSPVRGQSRTSNATCNPVEASELCVLVPIYEVVGSECAQLPWTPEFALGRGTRNLCFSQVGIPPCKVLVREIVLTICEQRQCIDCMEGEPPASTARWCRNRCDYMWQWRQWFEDLPLCQCDPVKVPIEPIVITLLPDFQDTQ